MVWGWGGCLDPQDPSTALLLTKQPAGASCAVVDVHQTITGPVAAHCKSHIKGDGFAQQQQTLHSGSTRPPCLLLHSQPATLHHPYVPHKLLPQAPEAVAVRGCHVLLPGL